MNDLIITNSENSIQSSGRLTDSERFNQLKENWILSLQLTEVSAKTYRKAVAKYFDFCHDEGLHPLTPTNVYTLNSFALWVNDMSNNKQDVYDKYGNYVRTITYSTATIRNWAGKVSQFFKWLGDNGICEDITKTVKLPTVSTKHKRENLPNKLVSKLINHVNTMPKDGIDSQVLAARAKVIVYLSIYAGLRMVEVSRLEWDDIQAVIIDDDKAVVVPLDEVHKHESIRYRLMVHGKGRKANDKDSVAVNSELMNAINEYKDFVASYIQKHKIAPPHNLVFSLSRATRGKSISANTTTKITQKIMVEANVYTERLITPHSLRHTFISKLANQKGMPLQNVVKYARHKHSSTTMRYIHNDDNVQYDDLDKLKY